MSPPVLLTHVFSGPRLIFPASSGPSAPVGRTHITSHPIAWAESHSAEAKGFVTFRVNTCLRILKDEMT